MSRFANLILRPFKPLQCWVAASIAASGLLVVGCQDGPLYVLKAANPYYSMREWKKDDEIGVTDHERRMQLSKLAETVSQMPNERQQFWAGHLDQMLTNDQSPEMRRLCIRAAGQLKSSTALQLIEKGLDDESMKVRMEACQALGVRKEEEASLLLAATIGSETSDDVRHAALAALGNHDGPTATKSLRLALSDRNPATRALAMDSLRGVTGKNYGDDPDVWIAALDGKPAKQVETKIADRVRNLF